MHHIDLGKGPAAVIGHGQVEIRHPDAHGGGGVDGYAVNSPGHGDLAGVVGVHGHGGEDGRLLRGVFADVHQPSGVIRIRGQGPTGYHRREQTDGHDQGQTQG